MSNNFAIIYKKVITRTFVRWNTDALFVFGDNMVRRGLGGQASVMRGEPNSVGIPTKWKPSMATGAFFCDGDLPTVSIAIEVAFHRLETHEGDIYWPADGIGTGMARLKQCAPGIWNYIDSKRQMLESGREIIHEE